MLCLHTFIDIIRVETDIMNKLIRLVVSGEKVSIDIREASRCGSRSSCYRKGLEGLKSFSRVGSYNGTASMSKGQTGTSIEFLNRRSCKDGGGCGTNNDKVVEGRHGCKSNLACTPCRSVEAISTHGHTGGKYRQWCVARSATSQILVVVIAVPDFSSPCLYWSTASTHSDLELRSDCMHAFNLNNA